MTNPTASAAGEESWRSRAAGAVLLAGGFLALCKHEPARRSVVDGEGVARVAEMLLAEEFAVRAGPDHSVLP